MIIKDSIEQLKEKTQLEYQRALGIWDLPLGGLIFIYGLQACFDLGAMFFVLLLSINNSYLIARKKYVLSRLGRAEFDGKAKKQNMLFFIILMYLLLSFAAAAVFINFKTAKGININPGSMTFYLGLLSMAIVAVGGFMRRTLLYIYASAMLIPVVVGLYIPIPAFVIPVAALTMIVVYALLKLFVYDWSGLDRAQHKPGIVGHYLTGFVALYVMLYLVMLQVNPVLVKSLIAQTMEFSNFYAGILTAGFVFLVGYAFSIKSYYWYAPVILLFAIIYRFQIIDRLYFQGLFMLFGIFVIMYRTYLLERFIRNTPVAESD